jgi:uncharacterized protein (TIGR00255 family)
MTAFARVDRCDENGELAWELRSVNHRYLEVFVRLPDDLRVLEPRVRERVNQRLGRGKVECVLRYRPAPAASGEIQLNSVYLDQLLAVMQEVRGRLPSAAEPDLLQVLGWPDVVQKVSADLTPVQEAAMSLLEQALDELVATREREGARLAELILARCDQLEVQVEKARSRMPQVIESLRQRLRERLEEVTQSLDQERLEQEMVILAQRLDVDEEMDRLATHIREVRRVLTLDEPVGRRLDFLMQELHREANTLGAKSADAETTAISVEMKVLIEQMREQVQNIE